MMNAVPRTPSVVVGVLKRTESGFAWASFPEITESEPRLTLAWSTPSWVVLLNANWSSSSVVLAPADSWVVSRSVMPTDDSGPVTTRSLLYTSLPTVAPELPPARSIRTVPLTVLTTPAGSAGSAGLAGLAVPATSAAGALAAAMQPHVSTRTRKTLAMG